MVIDNLKAAIVKAMQDNPAVQAIWKELTLNRDCYVEFEQSYYSAPYRLLGQKLWVCGNLQQIRIFDTCYQLVATQDRAIWPGTRRTQLDHLPSELVPDLTLSREGCRQQAQRISPATSQIVNIYLADPVVDPLLIVGRLLRLGERYGPQRLEAACARALAFGDPNYRTIKRILQQELDQYSAPPAPLSPPGTTFVHSPDELFGPQLGATRWN